MSSTDKTRIIDKVKKLLAIATSSTANVHEAETAMRQARSLMAQHNLDEGAFEALGATSFGVTFFDTIWCVSAKKPVSPFMLCFIALLKDVFNVSVAVNAKPLYRGTAHIEDRARLEFYGDTVDAQLCAYSAHVVWRSLNADREVYAREHCLRGLPMARQRAVLQSYSIAWLRAARVKLAEVFKNESKQLAAKAYRDLTVTTTPLDGKKFKDFEGASASGHVAGKQFNISRPMDAQRKELGHG